MTTQTALTEPSETLTEAKPSDIVRSQPRDRWEEGVCRHAYVDGAVRYCRVGWLALTAGWYEMTWQRRMELVDGGNIYRFVAEHYGLPFELVGGIVPSVNDGPDGYAASLRALEEAGY